MKTRFFALAALALALVACNNENENLNGDPVAALFTANIAPATRASGTTWTGGDRIGITDIGNDSQYGNVPFILKNGKFEAEGKVIYFEDTKTHTFCAYYPYNAAGWAASRYPSDLAMVCPTGFSLPKSFTASEWGIIAALGSEKAFRSPESVSNPKTSNQDRETSEKPAAIADSGPRSGRKNGTLGSPC